MQTSLFQKLYYEFKKANTTDGKLAEARTLFKTDVCELSINNNSIIYQMISK